MGRLGIAFQTNKPLRDYARLGKLVDRYDFYNVTVYEDLFFQPAWPALMQIALNTERVRVGPSVVNPYTCHPAVVASNLAVLEEASRGRAYLGVGKGAFLGSIGLQQPRPLRAIREMVELVQRFLRGDRMPYRGEIFEAGTDAYLRFKAPGYALPVLVGSWGEKTCALAGEIADEVKVGGSVSPDAVPVFRRYIETGASRAGRDPGAVRLVFGSVTVVDRDRREAEALARREVAMYIPVVSKLDPTYRAPEGESEAVRRALAEGDVGSAAQAISTETLRRYACYGTPEDIVQRLKELFEAGVDRFELGTPHGRDEGEAIELLGNEVLPAFT